MMLLVSVYLIMCTLIDSIDNTIYGVASVLQLGQVYKLYGGCALMPQHTVSSSFVESGKYISIII